METPKAERRKSSILVNPLLANNNNINNSNLTTPKSIERKKKTVRFNEQTQFFNEKNDLRENEKGHFLKDSEFKKPFDITNPISNIMIKQKNIEMSQRSLINFDNDLVFKSSLNSKKSSNSDSSRSKSASSNEYIDDNLSSFVGTNSNSFPNSIASNSNDTIILEEANDTIINNTKNSFFEYDSILFPKANKYTDYLSFTQDMNTIIEDKEDSLPSQKESKKDKKIINPLQNVNNSQNGTSNLILISMELHVNTRGI